ncbi:DUF537-domain-containing protein [Trametes cingulata]|nr:DUF537-domain-containing protein [Trametes cingulata]
MNASNNVAVFWDYENCALPATEPSYTIINKIRRLAHQYGSVKTFKAYLEYPEQTSPKSMALRSELQSCGVSLIDCPHNGRKDVADKMMMVDMMAHAIDNPAPATIILISGDRDFVYAVSILSLRQYRIVLLAPRCAHGGLKGQADAVYNWPEDFLPELPVVAQPIASPKPRTVEWAKPSKPFPVTLQDFWQQPLPTQPSSGPIAQSAKVAGDPNPFALLAPEASMSTTPEGGAKMDLESTHPSEATSSESAAAWALSEGHPASAPVAVSAETNTVRPTILVFWLCSLRPCCAYRPLRCIRFLLVLLRRARLCNPRP